MRCRAACTCPGPGFIRGVTLRELADPPSLAGCFIESGGHVEAAGQGAESGILLFVRGGMLRDGCGLLLFFFAQEAGAIDESFIEGISTDRFNGNDMA